MPKPSFNSHAKKIEEIIRVDHAGEYGARRIYEGQLHSIKDPSNSEIISHMYQQELVHLEYFEKEIKQKRIKPTIFMPLWHVGGFLLGAITAKLGFKTAMLCTEAVEEVIQEHYQKQLDYLKKKKLEPGLAKKIQKFREEEIEHQNAAKLNDSDKALLKAPLAKAIKALCRVAIAASQKF